jgi:hypothetical protein
MNIAVVYMLKAFQRGYTLFEGLAQIPFFLLSL